MKRKILSFLLALTLCLSVCPLTALADMTTGFTDVPEGAWYAGDVKTMIDAGVIDGVGNNRFAPNQNVTVAETIKLAATIYCNMTECEMAFEETSPWYQTYVDFLARLDAFPDTKDLNYNAPANRDLFAKIMSGLLDSLPEDELKMNNVDDGMIPDVTDADSRLYIYEMYRAGIVVGSDSFGRYNPSSNILRSEAAAIANRFLTPSARKSITLEAPSQQPDSNFTAYANEVLKLCNNYRSARGLRPLVLNVNVCSVADQKAKDMASNKYFSHTSPTYGTPFDMLRSNNIAYAAAAENIAKGYTTPQAVVEAWMNSESHKANILSSTYTQMGVGYDANGGYWSQVLFR